MDQDLKTAWYLRDQRAERPDMEKCGRCNIGNDDMVNVVLPDGTRERTCRRCAFEAKEMGLRIELPEESQ